jgi:hypothetical protein
MHFTAATAASLSMTPPKLAFMPYLQDCLDVDSYLAALFGRERPGWVR